MSTQAKILHVFGRMHRGGAEMRTLDVMRHIDRSRFQFEFCVLSGLPGDLDSDIRTMGGEVHYLPLGPTFPFRFLQLLKRGGFSAVHSHVHMFSGAILWLAALVGIRSRIAHFRTTDDGRRSTRLRRAQAYVLRFLVDRNATSIVGVCRAALDLAWGSRWMNDARCSVVYNGLPLTSFYSDVDRYRVRNEFGVERDSHLCIHVGRFDPEKNHVKLLQVFAALAAVRPKARLLLVGRGTHATETRVRDAISSLRLNSRVIVAGVRSDVPRLLLAADLLLFPSLWEGLPGVVLEGCAAGIPIVASDLPGVREIQAHFPRIATMSLNDSDFAWATTAARMLDQPRADMQAVRAAFDRSPFAITECVDALSALWLGAEQVANAASVVTP